MFERAMHPAARVRAGHMLVQQHWQSLQGTQQSAAAVCLYHAAVWVRAICESKGATHPGSAFLPA